MQAKLTQQEIMVVVNRYIGVTAGYLGDFTYRSHQEFYAEYCGVNVDTAEYDGTTRERFIAILDDVDPADQARILRGVLERFPLAANNTAATRTNELCVQIQAIIARLEGSLSVVGVNPRITSDVPRRAMADAEALIQSSGATSGVDRVHTALHAHLLAICDNANLLYADAPSVTQLYKLLREQHPALKRVGTRAEDVERVLRALATVLDALQPVRNMASVAHPNRDLLPTAEAMLVINAARSIMQYLDSKLA